MLPIKYFCIRLLLLVVCSLSLIALFNVPSYAQAGSSGAAQCDQPIKVLGPEVAYPAAASSCSDYADNSKNFNDFLDTATVHCLDKAELDAVLQGKAELIDQYNKKKGDVSGSLDAQDNTNVTLGNSSVTKDTANGSKLVDTYYSQLANVSMQARFDNSLLTSHCNGLNQSDYDKCAATMENGTTSDGKRNDLTTSSPQQRLTNIPDQIREACKRADLHVLCSNSANINNYLCGNEYSISRTSTIKSSAIAAEMKSFCKGYDTASDEDLQAKFDKLSSNKQATYLGLEAVKSAQKFYIVIRPYCPKDAPTWLCGIYNFFSPFPDPLIIEAFLPAAPEIAQNMETDIRRWLSPEEGNAVIGAAKASTGSVAGKTRDEKLINKVKLVDPDCSIIYPSKQFMGSHAESQSSGGAKFTIGFDFFGKKAEEAQKESLRVYKAWVIAPVETTIMENLSKATLMRYLPPEYFPLLDPKNPQNIVTSPQSVIADPPHGNTDAAYELVEVPCPSGEKAPCYDQKNKSDLTYNHAVGQTGLKSGSLPYAVLNTSDKMWQSLQDLEGNPNPNHAGNAQCYYPYYKSNNGTFTSAMGSDKYSEITADNGQAAACGPNLAITTTDTPGNADVCAIASKYNLPCGFLMAIWAIETRQSPDQPNCAVKGKASGPFQIFPGEVGGVFSSNEKQPDLCTVSGGAEIVARLLLKKKYCAKAADGTWPSCPTGMFQPGNSQYTLSPDEVEIVARYNGSNGCAANNETQCRWGTGVSYCDAVKSYMTNGSLPKDNCTEMYCSQIGQHCSVHL